MQVKQTALPSKERRLLSLVRPRRKRSPCFYRVFTLNATVPSVGSPISPSENGYTR
jgi:hypothetical protein